MQQKLLDTFIKLALKEDVGPGDHTPNACISVKDTSKARCIIKDDGILAGMVVARRAFKLVDPKSKFKALIKDGATVEYGDIAFEVTCNTRKLLLVERLVLNTMQRLSGIASMADRFAAEVEGLPVKILDTRKTTPLMRFLEKYAVKCGGCYNYRDGLYDWIMIKDNHIDACGSIEQAILQVKSYLKKNKLRRGITIEVRNLVELYEVLRVGGVTRIMFDNFEIPILKEAVAIVKGKTDGGKFETEASGGVTLKNVRKIALTGVDYISSGALTHSAGQLDISLKIMKNT
ncbi:MAG: carboxylating nicotinate-nucleotide diphosphorylase [Saprospiraceae bacterium]